jgi:hypothetical protein
MVMRGGYRPYQGWFNQKDYGILGNEKSSFFTRSKPIELSPCFEDFRVWLEELQLQFVDGFTLKTRYMMKQKRRLRHGTSAGEVDNSFDDETLGNNIHYASFIGPVRWLSGELKGLIIRYDPKAIPLPTPTGAPSADDA